MAKILTGTVVSLKMHKTVIVEISGRKPHPLYGKLMKVSKRLKADVNSQEISLGDKVEIVETRPLGSGKYFKVNKVFSGNRKENKK